MLSLYVSEVGKIDGGASCLSKQSEDPPYGTTEDGKEAACFISIFNRQ